MRGWWIRSSRGRRQHARSDAGHPVPGGGVGLRRCGHGLCRRGRRGHGSAGERRTSASHPRTHVILLDGHARGFAEQVLSPAGTPATAGLPNFTVADAGVPAYAPEGQGGFYHYALFHVLPDGNVQFAVQPLLASISITAPSPSLRAGTTEKLSATGTSVTGDDLRALQIPIADPASHVWSTSNPRVATIDPRTGELTARSPGTVTVTLLCGAVTATTAITVDPWTQG